MTDRGNGILYGEEAEMKKAKRGLEAGRETEGKEGKAAIEIARETEDLADDLGLRTEKGAVQEIENEVDQENEEEVNQETEVEETGQKMAKIRVDQADLPVGVEIKRDRPRKRIIMHHKVLVTHILGPVPEVRTEKQVT